MGIVLWSVIGLFVVLLVTAGIHDARRRRKGLPVNGPDGLRGYTTTPNGIPSTGGIVAGGGMAAGGGLGDGGGMGCDGGGGGGSC